MHHRCSIYASLLLAASLLIAVTFAESTVRAGDDGEINRLIAELRADIDRLTMEQNNLSPAQKLAIARAYGINHILHDVIRESDLLSGRMFANMDGFNNTLIRYIHSGPGPSEYVPTTQELRESVFHLWLDMTIVPPTPAGGFDAFREPESPLTPPPVAAPTPRTPLPPDVESSLRQRREESIEQAVFAGNRQSLFIYDFDQQALAMSDLILLDTPEAHRLLEQERATRLRWFIALDHRATLKHAEAGPWRFDEYQDDPAGLDRMIEFDSHELKMIREMILEHFARKSGPHRYLPGTIILPPENETDDDCDEAPPACDEALDR